MTLRRADKALIATVLITLAVVLFLVVKVIFPGYQDESNRTYTSRFGYPALKRKLGQPFPVKSAEIERRYFSAVEMGEGILGCEHVVASLVPQGRIMAVHVHEGDRVSRGQLLAEIDPTYAEAAFEIAKLQRFRNHALAGERRVAMQ